ncbi:hypothetical protein [Afipia broomeae]|uniref:Uncharacterized protein n=1 Tax=Afipia broomeae ATCC 49717 TaxID=883078 RepID=K8P9J6_9BRAD|nr:hypothetical protein [Afipia broomeae]EKS36250.1 hypothetical protein HMPREF9695_02668 [Afipia broomeae ATCC 49717]
MEPNFCHGYAFSCDSFLTGVPTINPTQIAKSAHDQFMQVVHKELEAFEKREREFLARERQERAEELKLAQQQEAGRLH